MPATHRSLVGLAAHAMLALLTLTACGGSQQEPRHQDPPAREPGGAAGALTRYAIDPAAFPEAVCNDGSTPVFYLRKGEEKDKWVVWFKGGGACLDAASCADRERSLTSSKPWMKIDVLGEGNANSADGGANGILSTNPDINPDFHAWNHVYLVYCSSDNWVGNRGLSDETHGMHFRGHQITTAMFAALQDPNIVGPSTIDQGTEIILSGSSAGAAGLRNNIDRLAPMFPNAKVRGFSDAGLTPEVTPKRTDGDAAYWKQRVALWNPVGDASCLEVHTGGDSWKCYEGRYLAVEKHIQTPTFYHMDLRDPKLMGDFDPKDPDAFERSRSADFEVRKIMSSLEGAFAPANHLHIVLDKAAFGRETCEGVSAAEVFGNWYYGRPGPKNVMDDGPGAGRGEGDRGDRGRGDKGGDGRGGRGDGDRGRDGEGDRNRDGDRREGRRK